MIFVVSLQILNIYFLPMILAYYVQIIILKKLCNTISNKLDELQNWFIVNKLSLSIEKRNYMIFSNKRIDKSNIFIKIDQKLINQVMITKSLGVMIDGH